MRQKLITSSQVILWLVVAGFVAGAASYGFYVRRTPSDNVWCGNMLTDPLSLLLSYGAPAAAGAVAGLTVLGARGWVRSWNPICAGTFSAIALAALLVYGEWLFRTMLPGFRLSGIVWWLRPVWETF